VGLPFWGLLDMTSGRASYQPLKEPTYSMLTAACSKWRNLFLHLCERITISKTASSTINNSPRVWNFFLQDGRMLRHGPLATAYTHRLPGEVSCVEATYPFRRFEIIGKSCHGALYALHRFGNQDISLNAALRLSAWVMREVYEQDTSTGGDLQIYVLSPNSQIIKKSPEEISELIRAAEAAGSGLGDLLAVRD